MEKIKVLLIAASLKIGGAEKVARDISLYAPLGRYEFHYVVFGDSIGAYESQVQEKGHKVFHFPEPSKNYLRFLWNLLSLMKENKYQIVHAHNMFNCGLTMLAAAMAGVPVRIVHSHSALNNGGGIVKQIYEAVMRFLILSCGTDYIACSTAAGKRLFGNKVFEQKVRLILNGIDVQLFAYDQSKREQIRCQHSLQDCFALGHAGHLAEVKNQSFLLDLMPLILEKQPDAVLLLLGEGEDRPMLEQKIRDMHLEDHVVMTGNVTNVADYLSAMDVFVFPSLFEGMPLSILEVQANGLPCVISDSVPADVFVTDLIHPMFLAEPKAKWAETICSQKRKDMDGYNERMRHSDYTVENAMAKIYQIYEKGTGCD